MFDKVVLLSEGCPIYNGPASSALDYFESVGFSTPMTINPADLLLDLANGTDSSFCFFFFNPFSPLLYYMHFW